ncbi:histidine phosphatase family protein [Planosporangium flavigriseum]|uniref:Phosphoglycerate mutase n=1 Tax=Planosporangium flavigriseum TaxID=373681 RepID=A0A8J3M3N7_9ACTN|nr:histidine phosphatase family protein [Planosporangium flavigriseum]NJC66800.1 histidine phosphatase family protein [Planosporangium flavigriseum]GIG76290.1 phosphoglycerate mutase [Planosporangium flavigriseum]
MAELEWLGIVRHGESTGNVAAAQAENDGVELIDIPERDADVPLSPTGREQAAAVRHWLADQPAGQRPEVAVASPYLRTMQTAELALDGLDIPLLRDERLRDRELGILDLLTTHGVQTRLPTEAVRRQRLGKFYYRPPGGESWADMALRLRSLLGDLRRDHEDGRVLLIGHEAVVFLLRYLLENLTEAGLNEVARDNTISNCSITSWRRGADGTLSLADFNRVDHLRREGATPTQEEEVHAEPV